MYQIDNHNELALASTIPYLLQFNEIYKLAEQSGDRAQIIENIAWQLLYNLDYENAEGIWLDYIGKKVGQSRIYTPKPVNAFTFGGTTEEGFGAGKFKSPSSIRSTKSARTDYSFRNAIKAKIIQNNTDTSVDELISACKLLFNSKLVKMEEEYPASIKSINVYGSNLIEILDSNEVIKNIIPAGVSLETINFHNYYNYFYNDAFIEYQELIPETDDFELSFIIQPDKIPTDTIAILSQGMSYAYPHQPVQLYYDPDDGFMFSLSTSYYNDSNIQGTYYEDEDAELYEDSDIGVELSGGADSIVQYEPTSVKITRVGNTFSMYVNGNLIDQKTLAYTYKIDQYNIKLFLGLSNNIYYNSGSIYNLLLENKTTNTILLNDSLKTNTIGINNGVRFL